MKTYRLSSASERVSAAVISGVLALLMGFLLYALREEPLTLVFTGVAALLVAAVLAFYLMSLFKAACEADGENMRLTVHGFPDDTIDLSRAASVKTSPCSTGPISTRALVFSDSDGNQIASVPTFFTSHQGAQAEPLAAKLAQELGIVFEASLEPWEYDKKCRAAHKKEAAQARADARRTNCRKWKAKRIPGKAETSVPSASRGENLPPQGDDADAPDGINYDALDDER
ncbi:MAG: hypothetical protein PUD80_04125 [Firmicutes bacterium]|nr:hypothetical protein [Bacillota bacterium]